MKLLKLLLSSFFLLILLYNVGAVSFQDSVNVNANVGSNSLVPIQVTNSNNFTIYDFSFENFNFTTFSTISVLEPNMTAYVLLKTNPSVAVDKVVNVKSTFKVLQDIPRDPKTFSVILKDTSYEPSTLDIKEGDSINFTNLGSSVHSIRSVNDNWGKYVAEPNFNSKDFDLQPSESRILRFDNIGSFSYSDRITSLGGVVNVVNKSSFEKVVVPQIQKQLTINYKSFNPETIMAYTLYTPSFSIQYNKHDEGIIEVKNVGNKSSVNTVLSGQWMSFDVNSFNLEPNENKKIKFTIKPDITRSSDTGKSYILDLYITTNNAPQLNSSISVVIPKSEIVDDVNPNDINVQFSRIIEYCNQNPDVCKGNGANGTIQFRDKLYAVNLTYDDMLKLQRDIGLTALSISRVENAEKRNNDAVNIKLDELSRLLNVTATNQQLIMEDINSMKNWRSVLIVILLLLLVAGFIVMLYNKYKVKGSYPGMSG